MAREERRAAILELEAGYSNRFSDAHLDDSRTDLEAATRQNVSRSDDPDSQETFPSASGFISWWIFIEQNFGPHIEQNSASLK